MTDAVQLDGERHPISLKRESVELLGMFGVDADPASPPADSAATALNSISCVADQEELVELHDSADESTNDALLARLKQVSASHTDDELAAELDRVQIKLSERNLK